MIAVTYRITLEEPLLATSLQGEPNSAISYDYIPGSLIRGAVAGRLATHDDEVDLATDERTLLFNGAARYLNAYPGLAGETTRRLPTPLSWKVKKEEANQDDPQAKDFAHLSAEERRAMGQTKDLSGYTLPQGSPATRYAPERQIAVHTLRDRNAGRSTQALGSVYRYDALATGEQFLGAVLTETIDQARRIESLLKKGYYRLGGAQGGGYGKVTISDVLVNEEWAEVPGTPGAIQPEQQFRVTLLSDAILRDEWGVTTTDLTSALPFQARPDARFIRTTHVGGFNRKWGLPLPQEQALGAGSVFVFQAARAIPKETVQHLLEEGVGERRAEGFGRLAIDWGADKAFPARKVHRAQEPPQVPSGLGHDAEQIALRMETRLLRRNLDRALVQAVQGACVKGSISNSQLSRLRIVARSALAGNKTPDPNGIPLQRLVTLFDASKPESLRPTALRKYSRVQINGKRLPDWIVELAQDPQLVWKRLDLRKDQGEAPGDLPWLPSPLRPGPVSADHRSPELAVEYAVRLMDGVLEKKMKENR